MGGEVKIHNSWIDSLLFKASVSFFFVEAGELFSTIVEGID